MNLLFVYLLLGVYFVFKGLWVSLYTGSSDMKTVSLIAKFNPLVLIISVMISICIWPIIFIKK